MMTVVSNKTKTGYRMVLGAVLTVALMAPGYAADRTKVSLEPEAGLQRVISGAAERLELADTIRMISQEIPASACHLSNGIAPSKGHYRLKKAKKWFPRYLKALEFGDADYNIVNPETRPSALRNITEIKARWANVDDAIYRLSHLPQDADAISLLRAETDSLFQLTSLLVSELAAVHSNPVEMTALDAILLDIAGREAALIQQISKTSCEVWAGDRSEERLTALSQSIDQFEQGILALLGGLPELGIIPAPTSEIEMALAVLAADWAGVRETLDQVLAGDADKGQMTTLVGQLNENCFEMARIVGLYTDYSKRVF